MKANSTSFEFVLIAILAAPLIYLGINWNQLPAEITTHYNLSGRADGWMSKENATVFTAAISLVLYLTLRLLPRIDPKGQLQTANYQKLRFVVMLMFSAIMGWLFYMAGHAVTNQTFMSGLLAIVSLLLAGIGNYMTTVKPNWFVGIRTPWTLANEVVWRKTHRMGGRLMFAGGLLGAVLAFVVPMPYTVAVVMAIILLVALVPVVYSYIYSRQEKTHQLN